MMRYKCKHHYISEPYKDMGVSGLFSKQNQVILIVSQHFLYLYRRQTTLPMNPQYFAKAQDLSFLLFSNINGDHFQLQFMEQVKAVYIT